MGQDLRRLSNEIDIIVNVTSFRPAFGFGPP